jgi:valyl-tRNA synthetase
MTEKVMNKELPKTYTPEAYEDAIYKKWEESGFFNPDVCVAKKVCKKNAEPFTIVLPPPNITDKLHLGHMVMVAVSDILIRYNRMRGKRALWIPGTDHAAIATQNVVEKRLWKEKHQTRHDLGREKFLAEVWQFVKTTQATIIHQLKKTGASLDWSREAFTLDETRQAAVKQMFIDMYNEGVIYQGYRVVNWCPRCQSTLADDEVEYKKEKGKLYWLKYGPFILATSRPETKLGDTAVAVYPGDERYKDMVGKKYQIPGVLGEFEITVVADRAVDPKFGSGAIKVTPAHDFTDYEISQRHGITMKQIINEEGKMMANCGKYAGLTTAEARAAIVKDMEDIGLIDHIEEGYEHNVAVCYRCGTTIEPLPSKQWFVAVDKKIKKLGGKSLKEKAIAVAKSGEIKFVPERFTKRYLDWMENLHDWCISRQIWFGHQIPAYYKGEEVYVGEEKPGENWTQDSDVLDTWFSSGMWTFSTLGYLKKTNDLKTYHPTQVLETGYEIITLWVSRMIMMSLFAMNEIPFTNVYLHGMVLDAQGKKMSKSKGNGIDPLEMIQKYGTDAVRMSLIVGNTPGNDTRMSEQKIADFRNFANKLWNIARYTITFCHSERSAAPAERSEESVIDLSLPSVAQDDKKAVMRGKKIFKNYTLADKWILEKMGDLIKATTEDIENFRFSQAGERLRDFTWNDLADWYLEAAKFEHNEMKGMILKNILEDLLKLWHPFMPFVTEAIWSEMGSDNLLMVAPWPAFAKATAGKPNENKYLSYGLGDKMKSFEVIINVIKVIRNLRSEYKIPPTQKVKAVIYAGAQLELLQSQAELIKNLRTGIGELEIKPAGEKLPQAAFAAVDKIEIYIPLADLVDLEKEKARMEKRAQELNQLIKSLESKLDNEEFVKRAPKEIVEAEIEKLENYRAEHKKLKEQKKHLK